MPDHIALDLGEYGTVLVEAEETHLESDIELVQAGILDDAKQIVVVKAQALLQRPLTGLANIIVASLPEEQIGEDYQLDEITVEFQLGFGVEAGADAGVVAKITPNGAFQCTYTWKRRDRKTSHDDKQ